MKKIPRPGAICRYVRLYGAISRAVAQETKNDATMARWVRNFRAIYVGDGAKEMIKARERAAVRLINTDYTD